MKIYCDFDGTISTQDSLKLLFDRFSAPEWRDLEVKIRSGQMSERRALEQMATLCRVGWLEAIEFLRGNLAIDPSFLGFVKWVESRGISMVILSGGFREIIMDVLSREGLGHLEVRSNRAEVSNGQWSVIPWAGPRLCETQTHCKCASLEFAGEAKPFRVYIGDGHTDCCPAERADLVFAKAFLAQHCEKTGIPFVRFESFADIQNHLSDLDRTLAIPSVSSSRT